MKITIDIDIPDNNSCFYCPLCHHCFEFGAATKYICARFNKKLAVKDSLIIPCEECENSKNEKII